MNVPNIDEFADDHEEQHAIGTGVGIGFLVAASGNAKIAGLVATVLVRMVRRKRPDPAEGQDLLNDLRREPHYFAGGLAVGGVLGLATRLASIGL